MEDAVFLGWEAGLDCRSGNFCKSSGDSIAYLNFDGVALLNSVFLLVDFAL